MWNSQLGALLGGATICIYDGNPGGRIGAADWTTLWRFVADAGATFFGAGAAFYASCLKAGIEPAQVADLSRLRAHRLDRLAAVGRVPTSGSTTICRRSTVRAATSASG